MNSVRKGGRVREVARKSPGPIYIDPSGPLQEDSEFPDTSSNPSVPLKCNIVPLKCKYK